jgi:hypothetical protein
VPQMKLGCGHTDEWQVLHDDQWSQHLCREFTEEL